MPHSDLLAWLGRATLKILFHSVSDFLGASLVKGLASGIPLISRLLIGLCEVNWRSPRRRGRAQLATPSANSAKLIGEALGEGVEFEG